MDQTLNRALLERREQGLLRRRQVLDSPQGSEISLAGTPVVSFCSNDYLGLANHPDVVRAFKAGADQYGVGSGASHLISGHSRAHHSLEEELAAFTGRSRALLFSSGYMANVGVITTLLKAGDSVFEDRLNHASLLDGGLFCQARFRRFPHRDYTALRAQLAGAPEKGSKLVVSDGVFSMDGDMADLPALLDTCTQHQALLMIDDAHGLGCLAEDGSGTTGYFRAQGTDLNENNCQILVGTLGKAFGTGGAFVAGSQALIESLIQFCRPYIYTTAMPAALAEATRCSLKLLREERWRRELLQDYIKRFRDQCRDLNLSLCESASPIQAVLFGDVERTVAASEFLLQAGIYVSAIRPPTVPVGTARLRITFSAAHTEAQFQKLLVALEAMAGKFRQ
ncbi:MAG: 8-amino-7-oxononanoate synthase [Pseudohongiellaceae bacterium]